MLYIVYTLIVYLTLQKLKAFIENSTNSKKKLKTTDISIIFNLINTLYYTLLVLAITNIIYIHSINTHNTLLGRLTIVALIAIFMYYVSMTTIYIKFLGIKYNIKEIKEKVH